MGCSPPRMLRHHLPCEADGEVPLVARSHLVEAAEDPRMVVVVLQI